MSSWDIELYSADLIKLSEIMDKYDVTPIANWYMLKTYAYQLKQGGYFDTNIEFLIHKKIAKTIPADVNQFKINFEFKCKADSAVDLKSVDPISEYSFQIIIDGMVDNDSKTYKSTWHLDKHIIQEGDGQAKYSHPVYHFQFGGKNASTIGTGELMLMGAPRLPHPPMDVFLGIHFILNNYFSINDYEFLTNLYENYDYQEIMKRARERMWAPYFAAFGTNSQHRDFTLKNVFPLAI